MITKEEEAFLEYWAKNRGRKKKVLYQMAVGMPLGIGMVVAIFSNFISGWYTRADMVLRTNGSQFVVLLIAAVGIVIFVTVFSVKHKWDINETRYRELMARKNKEQ